MEDEITPIWDAIGIINGTIADETIVIGNHRDAWIIGGAADPNSGTAIIVELAKAFGTLLSQGWKPKRNIVLASWDGEEYGLLGSTEWVEEYVPWLTGTAVSYLNIVSYLVLETILKVYYQKDCLRRFEREREKGLIGY